MTPDEIVGAMVDGGDVPTVDAASRADVAQRLFLHGLLVEHHANAKPAVAMARSAASADGQPPESARGLRRAGRWPRRLASSMAAAIMVGVFAFVFLQGDALPTAEATVSRAAETLAQPVDRHFVSHVFVGAEREPGRVGPLDWYVRADRWALHIAHPLGNSWLVGNGERMWWVGPGGRVWPVLPAIVNRIQREIDPTVLGGNLQDVLRELKTGYELTMLGREDVKGRRALRIRAVRKDASRSISNVEAWVEEATGLVLRAEVRFEPPNWAMRTHVLEFVDAEKREDAWYTPETHRR